MDNFYVLLWHDLSSGNGISYSSKTSGSSVDENSGNFMPGDKSTVAVCWHWNPILGCHF